MTKILSAQQIRELDAFTIDDEPIDPLDLMERASDAFCTWFASIFEEDRDIKIICGTGNNGGDGLAIARMLLSEGYTARAYCINPGAGMSEGCQENHTRLKAEVEVVDVETEVDLPNLSANDIVIDAVFGSGLSRKIESLHAVVIDTINTSGAEVIAVDIPSGLSCDEVLNGGAIIHADQTISFQVPKLSFMLPETGLYAGEWRTVDIGLSAQKLEELSTPFYTIDRDWVRSSLKSRKKFSHKGTYGRALLMVGGYGKMGAAVLSARAALRSGLGLLTCHIPLCGYEIVQTSVPEAMVIVDTSNHHITEAMESNEFNAVGVGPGIGTEPETKVALTKMLESTNYPMVIDADALNIIAKNRELLHLIPQGSILTPHLKEFDRIAGESVDDFERLKLQQSLSKKYKIVIILKGAHSAVSLPDGNVYFNTSGNPGMATAGSGDVLTGVLTGLLAQGYLPKDAARLGVYLHGLAGDIAKSEVGEEALLAGDIVDNLGKAFGRY